MKIQAYEVFNDVVVDGIGMAGFDYDFDLVQKGIANNQLMSAWHTLMRTSWPSSIWDPVWNIIKVSHLLRSYYMWILITIRCSSRMSLDQHDCG